MLKETLCCLLLVIGMSSAATFRIVNGPPRERSHPPSAGRHHIRNNCNNHNHNHHGEDEDDRDSDAALNAAEIVLPYRAAGGRAERERAESGGLDPLAVRAARLSAYRMALLRSIRAEEEFDNNNQHAGRGGGSGQSGSGGQRGGHLSGRRPAAAAAAHRDASEDGFRPSRPIPVQYTRTYRGHRSDPLQSRDNDDDDDDEYY